MRYMYVCVGQADKETLHKRYSKYVINEKDGKCVRSATAVTLIVVFREHTINVIICE